MNAKGCGKHKQACAARWMWTDACEDEQQGGPEGERGCEGREETTCIHEVSPPRHAYPQMMYVNRATARAISGSGNDDTMVTTPIAPCAAPPTITPIIQTVEELGLPMWLQVIAVSILYCMAVFSCLLGSDTQLFLVRSSTTDWYFWSLWTSEIAHVWCLWYLSFCPRLRSSPCQSIWWESMSAALWRSFGMTLTCSWPQMHLDYHKLHNMLAKFREEQAQCKMALLAAPTRNSSGIPDGTPAWSTSGGEVTLKFYFLMLQFQLLTNK